jgi:hypothetical protein
MGRSVGDIRERKQVEGAWENCLNMMQVCLFEGEMHEV